MAGKIIKIIRQNKGISQKKLAKMVGITQSYISMIEQDIRGLDVEILKKLAIALDVPPADLIMENVAPYNASGKRQPIRVPIISWVRAGELHEPVENMMPDDEDDWVTTDATNDPSAYALRVEGDSMEPIFTDGDIIIVSPRTQANSGDYCVIALDGEVTLKCIKYDDDKVRIIPLNEKYDEKIIRGERKKDLRVIAKVVEVRKRFK